MSTVKFMHFRKHSNDVVQTNGGATVAYIEGETGVSYGVAYCHDNDRYNRKKGRVIAEGRMRNERTAKASALPVEAFREAAVIEMGCDGLYRRS